MIKFDIEKVLLLHKLILESSGGASGVRDLNLLDSALESAFQTYRGRELFPTKEEKGARLCYGLITNHPFIDGNKRIGILVMLSFFAINGVKIVTTDEDLIKLGQSVADSKMKYKDVLNFVELHKEKEILNLY